MKTEGFYKNDNGELLFGPNFVDNGNYFLDKTLKDTYTYPIGGWYWFDSIEDACIYFGLELPPHQNSQEQI
jgi:hypothetical protein